MWAELFPRKQGGQLVNSKQFVIATVVGTIVLFGLGYLIWDMLFADFFAANSGGAVGVEREEQVIWALLLGTLGYAVFMNLVLGTRKQPVSVVDGLSVGAVVGFLLWFTADFTLYGVQDVSNLNATIADPLLELVRGAVTGGIVAAVVGMFGSR